MKTIGLVLIVTAAAVPSMAASALQEQPPGQLIQLSGRVTAMKLVDLVEFIQPHVVVRVQTDAGRMRVVDLGTTAEFRGMGLRKWSRITVRGLPGSINRKKTLMAVEVQAGDRQVRIDRDQDNGTMRFAGVIRETAVRDLGTYNQAHLVAMVELIDTGQIVVADLGSSAVLGRRGLYLGPNDEIVFLARPAEFAGKNILSATQLSIDGKIYRVGQKRRL